MQQLRLPSAMLLRAADRRPHLFFDNHAMVNLLPNSRISLLSDNGILEIQEVAANSANASHVRNITLDQPIEKVFSGTKTSALIDKGGAAYTFGENVEAQLGLGGLLGPVDSYHGGTQRAFVDFPEQVSFLFPEQQQQERVVSASMNRRHSLFLTLSGKVYSCGSSFDGALGLTDSILGNTRFIPVSTSPAPVEGLPVDDPVVSIGAGLSFSLALTASGKLFFFGRLGHGGVASVAATIDATRNGVKRNKSTAGRTSGSSSTISTAVHTEQSLFSPSPILLATLDSISSSNTCDDVDTNEAKRSVSGPFIDQPQISCGLHHALISFNNRVWSFGLSRAGSGALGSGPTSSSSSSTSSSLLHEIDLPSLLLKWGCIDPSQSSSTLIHIDSISCGPFSSAFCANGHAFLCGAISDPSLLGNVGSAAVNLVVGEGGGGGEGKRRGGGGVLKSSQSKSDLLLDLGLFFDDEKVSEMMINSQREEDKSGGVGGGKGLDSRFKVPYILRVASELVKPSSSTVFSAKGVSSPRFIPLLDTNIPFGKAQSVSIDESRVLVKLA